MGQPILALPKAEGFYKPTVARPVLSSQDAGEGVRAFAEKPTPSFQGR